MGLRVQDLRVPRGARRKRKRVGRGIGSGSGKTSGRGHKGAKSRSGGGIYTPGFEGGQMPLVRRVPKRGFTNKFKRLWSVVNIGAVQKCASVQDGAVIDKDFLLAKRILRKQRLPFKVLGKGKLTKSVTIKANSFSKSAKTAIEEAGGKVEIVSYKP